MNIFNLTFFIAFFLFSISECMLPWTKKNKAVNQMQIIKDISQELKQTAETLPTQEDISNKIHKIDNEVIDKLNDEIVKESLLQHKPHVCEEPSYERDYSKKCPEGWILNSSGQCWGANYDGHCESLKYFQEYSDSEKKEFELNCCVLWPKMKTSSKTLGATDTLRGSINANTGQIIKPKNI